MGVQKFHFETSFDKPGHAARKPTLSPREAARAAELIAAIERGKQAGLREAEAGALAMTVRILTAMTARIDALAADRARTTEESNRLAVEVALGVARKFLPAAARRNALEEVAALVKDCLAEAIDEPRLVVRVPDALLDPLKTLIEAQPEARAAAARLVLLADPALAATDCRVDWADGGAERNEAALWQEIDAVVHRALNQPTQATARAAETPAASTPSGKE